MTPAPPKVSATTIAHRRLVAQFLTSSTARTPQDVVARLGAVQAQDYAGAKWALALRAAGLTDDRQEDPTSQFKPKAK